MSRTDKAVAFIIIFIFILIVIAGILIKANNWIDSETNRMDSEVEEQEKTRFEERVLDLQYEILDDLALNCEVKGVSEPDATIVFDSNNEASIGRYQFQIKTVQHYAGIFLNNPDMTRLEAIQLAINKREATELARRIIFHETGGIFNWKNCERKLQLEPQITIIKKIM